MSDKLNWPWSNSICREKYDLQNNWPKISIVTPSYNQGQFIEETILSILNQNYPNLEYIIIDGGSTDNTVDVIKKYESKITFWVSEPDKGQADAINKGLKYCTGDIFNWINSDDLLAPDALFEIATEFYSTEYDVLAGAVLNDFDNSFGVKHIGQNKNLTLLTILKIKTSDFYYHQPGVWLKRGNMEELPVINSTLHYYFDWDYMLKYLSKFPSISYVNKTLVYFRAHNNSKTISEQGNYHHEILQVYKNFNNFLSIKHSLKKRAERKYLVTKWHQNILHKIKGTGYNSQNFFFIISNVVSDPRNKFTRLTLGQLKKFLLK